MNYQAVIGLEIHVQLATKSKLFSATATRYGAAPNTQASLIDLGMPGVLPVVNKRAVEMAVMFGLAVGAKIHPSSIFARKNYFYPDLPKGYQISQFEDPIVYDGFLNINTDGEEKRIRILRAHLEEDAGKSVHDILPGSSGIDLNRAGTPLIEVVSEPDMRCAKEAVTYMKGIYEIVTFLGICDGNMQEGSFRCDANVSLMPKDSTTLGTRTETKNLNSFKFVEKAILYEIERQTEILDSGQTVMQETRLYDPDKDETRSMRSKEEANDYRYFPDPDLLPIVLHQKEINAIHDKMPPLPAEIRQQLVAEYSLSQDDAVNLTNSLEAVKFFYAVQKQTKATAKEVANWMVGELNAALNRENLSIAEAKISVSQFASLLDRLADSTLSNSGAKKVFEHLWQNSGVETLEVDSVIGQLGLKQVSDKGAIEAIVDDVLANNPDQIEQFKQGKTKVIGFLVGQVMKISKGSANPKLVNEILRSKLQ